jgi:phospholipase C
LAVYGPNGFVRFFNGSIGSSAAYLDVRSTYDTDLASGGIKWQITNVGGNPAEVSVLNAYTGSVSAQLLQPQDTFAQGLQLNQFYGWYDLIVTVAEDTTFQYRLAGHVETGKDSFSDPALGGLVKLKG